MSTTYTVASWSVTSLTDSVESGSLKLPDLQRPFVWGRSKVRDLFDSMYRGYPVGQLMFWQRSPDEDTGRAIGGNAQVAATHQIIDGQQRLTSLFAVVKGEPVLDADYNKKTIKISFEPFTEKFEVQNAAILKSSTWIADIAEVFQEPFDAQERFIQRFEAANGEMTQEQKRLLSKNLTTLHNLLNYPFSVVTLLQQTTKETVADIFVRINSQGASLISTDFILTWLSVFWPDGRDEIETFARNSHLSAHTASEIAGHRIDWTPLNHFLRIDAGQIVRLVIAYGLNRGKIQDAYSALQARTREGYADVERQQEELDKLKLALPVVLNRLHWDEFWRAIQLGGFRSRKMVTSDNNLLLSYIVFLIGRERFKVDLNKLRVAIARWFFMAQLTGRYTGSAETAIQKELDAIGALTESTEEAFLSYLERIIKVELSDDYWNSRMPEQLISSVAGLSPNYQAYLAALNILNADLFMTELKVHQWSDPTVTAVKGTELHHLFPRAYLERELGITDIKRFNQIANFAPTDWQTNILISDKPPAEYWPELKASRMNSEGLLARQLHWHAMPENWEHLSFDDFLAERRKLLAQVTREGFEQIGLGLSEPIRYQVDEVIELSRQDFTDDVAALVDAGLLTPGEILTEVDPDLAVEAFVTADRTVMVAGQIYDSLDEAAEAAGAVNLSGLEFWARDVSGEPVSLLELFSS